MNTSESKSSLKVETYQIGFVHGHDALDVDIHQEEGWIELKTETTGRFPITSVEELDIIYKKLRKILKKLQAKNSK